MRLILALALAVPSLAFAAPEEQRGDRPGGGGVSTPTAQTGEQVYRAVCEACHMADAKGATGAGTIPALANNPRLGAAAYPISVVLKGKGAMPWLNELLSPAQIANVVGYVRTHFGNNYPAPVTEAEVSRVAQALKR